jgi:glycosyltransferase involved in cell wall biosynthesis
MTVRPVLSVVVPMYDEQDVLASFLARLRPVVDGLAVPYEVIAVDDGSRDATPGRLLAASRQWPQLRVIRLRRNVGHQLALCAGMEMSTGDYVVSIDADLQDPPEAIEAMLALARVEDLDVVYGVRGDRSSDTWFKRRSAALYYRLMRHLAGAWVNPDAGDFRLLSRAVVDVLVALPEARPVYRLVVPSLGFPTGTVTYTRQPRAAGTTKYPLRRMLALTFDSITSFSALPLRLATWLGIISFIGCVAMTIGALTSYARGTVVPGWTSLFIAVLLLSGVQLVGLGMLGEYVGRLFTAAQQRPRYLIAYDSSTKTPSRAGRV